MKALLLLVAIAAIGFLWLENNSQRQQIQQLTLERDQLVQEFNQKAAAAARRPGWFQQRQYAPTTLNASPSGVITEEGSKSSNWFQHSLGEAVSRLDPLPSKPLKKK